MVFTQGQATFKCHLRMRALIKQVQPRSHQIIELLFHSKISAYSLLLLNYLYLLSITGRYLVNIQQIKKLSVIKKWVKTHVRFVGVNARLNYI